MPFTVQKQKKKPPPRPPPPNFSKYKSKSTFNLAQPTSANLIEWSPPNSPSQERARHFGGSISSSFSSSTSSLASSKKSLEFESPLANNQWPLPAQYTTATSTQPPSNGGATFQSYISNQQTSTIKSSSSASASNNLNVPSILGPTIIRPKVRQLTIQNDNVSSPSGSPPMPNIPPPSPPKEISDIETSYGIVIHDYPASLPSDLNLQAGDVVILLHRINEDWLYGKVIDKEGMFPESFIDIQVPLKEEENIVTALYDFQAQMPGDLTIKTGQKIRVTKKISDDWLFGKCNGQVGQFPSNFVNRVPKRL
ncbi:uncharacterized protein B0303.7 [Euwallacea similis]|uniref:uncharacterized protein B0303.7 n=1 Tax=Euwallacea similis TaxID=1736056 RepID=UPI00344C0A37